MAPRVSGRAGAAGARAAVPSRCSARALPSDQSCAGRKRLVQSRPIRRRHMTLAEDFDRCTRCGLCEQACPTYRLLQFEPDSPRGRIFLMKQYARGEAPMSDHLAEHLYRCLGCRACETVCPAGVPYGRLLEYGRAEVEQHLTDAHSRRGWRRFRSWAFERVLPNRKLFNTLMAPARALQRSRFLRGATSSLPSPLLKRLVDMVPLPPSDGGEILQPHYQPSGETRAQVALFTGCVMRSLFEATHAATARVLAANGCEVTVIADQWCCGALNVHAGETVHASAMARHNIAVFERGSFDAIVVNSAGCGAAMKEYGALLADDPSYAERSTAFATSVRDATEFLAALGVTARLSPLRRRVTYQDACHLAHGQGIREQPRALLRAIPGLDYVELRDADRCCGAAGVYSLTQPELSERVLAEKLDALVDSRAQVVAVSNPGCHMQLQAGILQRRLNIEVRHVMELLDASIRGWAEKTEKNGKSVKPDGGTTA